MPIASYKPTNTPVQAKLDPAQLVKADDIYHTATVDNSVTAPSSLLVNLDGMPWTVDWFGQILNTSDDIREVDIGQNAALQQYQMVKNLELRVQSELSSSYDSNSALTTVTGSAIVVQVVPVKYDYFVTEVGNHETGLFMVTSVEQKTYNNKTVHEVNYSLIGYVSSQQCKDRWEAIQARVIRTFFFHKERVAEGGAPLLTLEDHYNAENLQMARLAILESYLSTFLSPVDGLLIVPAGHERIVDTRLVKFINETISIRESSRLRAMNVISTDKDVYLSKPCIWDALLVKQRFLVNSSLNKVAVMPKYNFASQGSYMTGASAWRVDGYLYPTFGDDNKAEQLSSVAGQATHDPKTLLTAFQGDVLSEDYCSSLENFVELMGQPTQLIKPAHSGGYYVLSEAFYKKMPELSLMEIMVRDILNNKPISMADVLTLANKYEDWPALEKFYYAPLLVFMIRDVVSGFY